MKTIKLSRFKRFLLFVLSLMVQGTYHTDCFAWTVLGANMSTYYCIMACTSMGYGIGLTGAMLASMVLASTNLSTAYCYCLTVAESQAMAACSQTSCGAVYTSLVGSGTGVYDLFNAFGYKPYGSCIPNQYKCGCKAGFKPYNGVLCSPCGAGYYCASTSSMIANNGNPCPAGRYSGSGASTCAGCQPGYYAAGTGNSKCTACPKGRYQGSAAASTCTSCPAVQVAALYNGSGVTQYMYGTTSTTARTSPTHCSLCVTATSATALSILGIYEAPGHYYDYPNCCGYTN